MPVGEGLKRQGARGLAGRLAIPLAARPSGWEVVGVDINEGLIASANRLAGRINESVRARRHAVQSGGGDEKVAACISEGIATAICRRLILAYGECAAYNTRSRWAQWLNSARPVRGAMEALRVKRCALTGERR